MHDTKKFLKKGMLFVAIVLCALVLVNMLYFHIVLKNNQVYRKEAMFHSYLANATSPKIQYAFMGDSHTRGGANPAYVPGGYNFATGAESYIKSYYKFRNILVTDNVSVAVLVLELDLHSLSPALVVKDELYKELWLYSQYMSFAEMSGIYGETALPFVYAYFPVIGRGEDFAILASRPPLSELHAGWLRDEGNLSLSTEIDRDLLNSYHTHFMNKSRIDPLALDYLLRMLALARDHNITVVFVRYPMSPPYREMIARNNVLTDAYYAEINAKLTATFNQTFITLDYYDLINDTAQYRDVEHLNAAGAAVLSKKLNTDLNRLNSVNTARR